jgi:hypothetical protein
MDSSRVSVGKLRGLGAVVKRRSPSRTAALELLLAVETQKRSSSDDFDRISSNFYLILKIQKFHGIPSVF